MAQWCLIPKQADEFIARLRKGEIKPEKLADMTSQQRRDYFTGFLGEANAHEINALFESKLLLKNQKQGYITWARKVGNLNPEAKKDLLSKIQKLDRVLNPQEESKFLEDLVAKKLGTDVTQKEAKQLIDLASVVEEKKLLIPENSPKGSKERIEYGVSYTLFQEYVQKLKLGGTKFSAMDYVRHPGKVFYGISGASKSFLSTLDNSFFGRQGVKTLFTNPDIWGKNFIKSWGDITKELFGKNAMIAIKADVYSRPNALNGQYTKMKVDIGISTEEAFPSSLPEKIPLLGRLFKASQSAFNGAALRIRADLADRLLEKAAKQGIDITDKTQLEGIGRLVNSMTGRGSIGKWEVGSKEINVAIFSIKFLKSNFDTLIAIPKTGYKVVTRQGVTFAEKEAAKNTIKIIGGIASVLATAKMLYPESVELDPRSSAFGKIKIDDTTYDVSGGMSSLVVLASRIVPTKHDGKWGFWYKSGSTGKYTQLATGKYGVKDVIDVGVDFFEGKAAPAIGLLRDVWKGQSFQGEKISVDEPSTLVTPIRNLATPISIQKFEQLQNAESADILAIMILETLGIGSTTYNPKK